MKKNKKKSMIYVGIICVCFIICYKFFLLYDKKDNFAEIQKGNFYIIDKIEESEQETLESIYQNQKEDMEWVFFDLNNDGKNELIWREKESSSEYMKSIVAIFAEQGEKCKLILFDTTDVREFYALENNHLIYFKEFSWLYQYDSFAKCSMNINFQIETDMALEVFIIPAYEYLLEEAGEEWVEDLEREYSFINGGGNYFRLTVYEEDTTNETIITDEQWKNKFEALIGESIELVNPYLSEIISKNPSLSIERSMLWEKMTTEITVPLNSNSSYKITSNRYVIDKENYTDYSIINYPTIEFTGDVVNKDVEKKINEMLLEMIRLNYNEDLENEVNAFYSCDYFITHADEEFICIYYTTGIGAGMGRPVCIENAITISLKDGEKVSFDEFSKNEDILKKIIKYNGVMYTDSYFGKKDWEKNKKEFIVNWREDPDSQYYGYYLHNGRIGMLFYYYRTGREKIGIEFEGIY